ncbi:MAG: hypothetical protein NVV57_01350 [Demequina sp.]|nr:hypothetical protein [Demequina sp.]
MTAQEPLPDAVVVTAPGVTEVAIISGDQTRGEEQAPPMPHRRAVASLIVLAMTAFLFSTNETSVIGVISLVADDMHRSEAAVGLVTTVWALVNMAVSIPAALLLRRLSRRWVLAAPRCCSPAESRSWRARRPSAGCSRAAGYPRWPTARSGRS